MGERLILRLLGLSVCFFGFFGGAQIFADTDCNQNSPITRDILRCANSSYARVDKKLNDQYRGLVADSEFSNKNYFWRVSGRGLNIGIVTAMIFTSLSRQVKKLKLKK